MSTYVNLGSDTVGHMELYKGKARLVALGCAGANPGCRLSLKCRELLQKIKSRKKKPTKTKDSASQTHEVIMLDDARMTAKCQWDSCGCGVTFQYVHQLINHIREQIEFQSVAPAAKQYRCEWANCKSKPRLNKDLLMTHIMDKHTGNAVLQFTWSLMIVVTNFSKFPLLILLKILIYDIVSVN